MKVGLEFGCGKFQREKSLSIFADLLNRVAASLTVTIPIFHRLSRAEFLEFETPIVENIGAEIVELKTRISRLEKQKADIVNGQDKI